MYGYTVTLTSHVLNTTWTITADWSPVRLTHNGIAGLTGKKDRQYARNMYLPGELPISEAIPAATGSLRLCIRNDNDYPRLYQDVRRAIATGLECRVTSRTGAYSCLLNLSGQLREPESNPEFPGWVILEAPMVNERGVWDSDLHSARGEKVHITNSGDTIIYPYLLVGATGDAKPPRVVLPDGTTLNPPITDTRRYTLSSDPLHGVTATTTDPAITQHLPQLRRTYNPQPLPPGGHALYECSPGISVLWKEQVLDPWC